MTGRPVGSGLLPAMVRALALVDVDDGCWIWRGTTLGSRSKYGALWDYTMGRQRPAHRIFFEQFRGPIPDGLQLDHICRTPLCVRPSHLEAVTAQENTLRGMSPSARLHRDAICVRGHAMVGENLQPNGIKRGRRAYRCRTCEAELRHRRIA